MEKKLTAEKPTQEQTPIQTKDPWIHRSTGMKCRSCMWFALKESSTPARGGVGHIGRCRRHAPTMNGYPVVFEADWCGDHKLSENI